MHRCNCVTFRDPLTQLEQERSSKFRDLKERTMKMNAVRFAFALSAFHRMFRCSTRRSRFARRNSTSCARRCQIPYLISFMQIPPGIDCRWRTRHGRITRRSRNVAHSWRPCRVKCRRCGNAPGSARTTRARASIPSQCVGRAIRTSRARRYPLVGISPAGFNEKGVSCVGLAEWAAIR